MPDRKEIIEVAGRAVTISNPDKVYFPRSGHTKLDLVRYYLSVAEGALVGVRDRPMVLKRFVHGAEGEAFFQKRAPANKPDWLESVVLSFPSGRTAEEIVVSDAAGLAWVANLGCIDLNPHPIRANDLDHPDELRVDLDPVPGVGWEQILNVALVARDVLADVGLTGWPKTSGSRGMHVYARIEPRWTFTQVRSAAVALAREIERRAPMKATSRWWKEERHGVFVDYNQNAKDRTVASAYSVRPTPDARVSTPLRWDEVPGCDPAAFTIDTVPRRYAEIGDPGDGIDDAVGSLDRLLELADGRPGGWPARCALAAALREAGWRGAAGAAIQAQDGERDSGGRRAAACARQGKRPDRAAALVDAAHRDRTRGQQGRGHGRPGALEGAAPGSGRAAGACRHPRRLDARPVIDVDQDPAEPPARPGWGAAATGAARSRLRPVAGLHRVNFSG